MHVGATSAHSSNGPSDINRSLLLPPTIATCSMTSDDHCSCWAHGTHVVGTGAVTELPREGVYREDQLERFSVKQEQNQHT
jgi:hypothetical protein